MLFNSYTYLLYFLPLALCGYFALGRCPRAAVAWLTAASFVFYAWWNPRHLPVMLASMAGNYLIARAMLARPQRAGAWLTFGVAANLSLLGVFKYADFFAQNAAVLTGAEVPLLHLALPLGISFFTFTQIAFLVDVRRGQAREPDPLNYALFVSFFPHLLAGPILHHREMMPQFASVTNKRPQASNLAAGLYLIALGLVKKVLLADNLAPIADAGFDQPTSVGTGTAWLAVAAFTLQIYFDFSGYTDMALGAARMFNIQLPLNFNSPYRAVTLRDFWRRWHMTLSRFLRDYLYIPLGGNRHGPARLYANLVLTFVLGGLWHGAAWTFVVWGALHGGGLVVERMWERTRLKLPPRFGWLLTLLFVMIAWVFFRAHSLPDALTLLQAMAGHAVSGAPSAFGAAFWHEWANQLTTPAAWPAGASALLLVLGGFAVTQWPRNSNVMAEAFEPTLVSALAVCSALCITVLQLGKVTPFLYFNF